MFREESQSEAEEIEKLIDERNEVFLWQLDLVLYDFWSGSDIFWAPKMLSQMNFHDISSQFDSFASLPTAGTEPLSVAKCCKPSNWLRHEEPTTFQKLIVFARLGFCFPIHLVEVEIAFDSQRPCLFQCAIATWWMVSTHICSLRSSRLSLCSRKETDWNWSMYCQTI